MNERASALLAADDETTLARAAGEAIAKEHKAEIERTMTDLRADIATWGDIEAQLHHRIAAVPEPLRARAAGVPGEVVQYETGIMCVGQHLPKHTHTLVAAAAVQILAGGLIRLHGLVSTEQWEPNGNSTTEHWRDQRETEAENAEAEIGELLSELCAAVLRTRPQFDDQRN